MSGIDMIIQERLRQLNEENFSLEHDYKHNSKGQLAKAAACYALPGMPESWLNIIWPWTPSDWKPASPDNHIKNLVRAGALIAAELDRLIVVEKKKELASKGNKALQTAIVEMKKGLEADGPAKPVESVEMEAGLDKGNITPPPCVSFSAIVESIEEEKERQEQQ